jgi:hypothetical protein
MMDWLWMHGQPEFAIFIDDKHKYNTGKKNENEPNEISIEENDKNCIRENSKIEEVIARDNGSFSISKNQKEKNEKSGAISKNEKETNASSHSANAISFSSTRYLFAKLKYFHCRRVYGFVERWWQQQPRAQHSNPLYQHAAQFMQHVIESSAVGALGAFFLANYNLNGDFPASTNTEYEVWHPDFKDKWRKPVLGMRLNDRIEQ